MLDGPEIGNCCWKQKPQLTLYSELGLSFILSSPFRLRSRTCNWNFLPVLKIFTLIFPYAIGNKGWIWRCWNPLLCYEHSMKMNKSMWGITHNKLFRQILQLLISVRYTCTSAWVRKQREREREGLNNLQAITACLAIPLLLLTYTWSNQHKLNKKYIIAWPSSFVAIALDGRGTKEVVRQSNFNNQYTL